MFSPLHPHTNKQTGWQIEFFNRKLLKSTICNMQLGNSAQSKRGNNDIIHSVKY